jgi:type I restriction enzyme S subunit
MKPYPKTKPSGVQWLGDVPEHWEVKRLKMAAVLTDKKVEADEENPVPYIGLEHIESWTGRLLPIDPDLVPTGIANAFEAGSVLFGKLRPYLAKACTPDFSGLCSTELLVLQGHDLDRHSLRYTLLSEGFIDLVDSSTYGSKMPRANWSFIADCVIPVPSPAEQPAIAAYLDQETGRIDELVDKKRDLIERLKEKRTALISRTVTRGVPADLPPATLAKLEALAGQKLPINPPLKPSGIDWLGDVPEHWEVKRLSYLALLQSGENITSEMIAEGGDYPVFGGNGFRGYYHRFTHKGHFALIGRQGALCGNVNYAKGEFWASEHALVVTPLVDFSVTWMGELLRSMNLGQYSITAAQPGISAEVIRSLRIPVPPLPEQRAIASYLDEETAKLDALVAKVETAIERLHEYRTALITAAVTGKINCSREVAK